MKKKIVDLIIILPKEDFFSHNLKILIKKLLEKGIDYKIIGEDNICESYSGDLFQCLNIKDAIKNNIYGKNIFLVGGEGYKRIIDNVLMMAYLNSYDLIKNNIFLEREAIFVFVELKKLFNKVITKITEDLDFYTQNFLVPLDEEVVVDDNLITTKKTISEKFVEEIIKKLINPKLKYRN